MGTRLTAFIARRWAGFSSLRHSRNIVRMGIICNGLCVCVMIVSVCILNGFRQEVSQKVFGFGAHVIIQPYLPSFGDETACVYLDSNLQRILENMPGVAHHQPYTLKGALVRGREESHGVLFKGVPPLFDTSFFAEKLKRGHLPDFSEEIDFNIIDSNLHWKQLSNEVLISEILADRLNIDTGCRLRAYFACEGQLRPRALVVCGIYSSGIEKFDETYIIGHIGQIQRLNGWNATASDGIDIQLKDPDKRQQTALILLEELPYRYNAFSCDVLFPEIFDWLVLVDANVWTLLIIMLIVCLICLISLLFILIMERQAHAAILSSMGAETSLIRRIFVQQTLRILGRGILWGNAVALAICALQKWTGLLKLNESVYFIDRVPVAFPWPLIVAINLLIIVCAYILLFIISHILQKFRLHKTIKSGVF